MPRNAEGQTPKQERFVLEYLTDVNATQAAIRAGYSAKTARFIGAENLAKPNIQRAIATRQQKLAEKLEISAERVLQEYAKLGFSDLRRIAAWDGHGVRYLGSAEVRDNDAAALSGVIVNTVVLTRLDGTIEERTTLRLTLHSKTQALDSLAKHLNLFKAHQESALSPLMQSILESWPENPPPYIPVAPPALLPSGELDAGWEDEEDDEGEA